jgi:hypothetical protein
MRLLALPLFAILALSAPAANSNAADTIAGTVRNETTGHPSVGDEVILLRLGEGMEVEGRTKRCFRPEGESCRCKACCPGYPPECELRQCCFRFFNAGVRL